MKQVTANFKVTVPRFNTTFFGQVIEKDGKLSIKGIHTYGTCAAERYTAKEMITKNWSSRNPEIFSNIKDNTNDSLVETLRIHTQELKNIFIEKTILNAEKTFEFNQKVVAKTYQEKLDFFGVPYTLEKDYHGRVNPTIARVAGGYTHPSFYKMNNRVDFMQKIVDKGLENFIAKEVKHAENHYESSLIKLAARLEAKGIKGNFEAVSGRIGENFEVTIKHGETVTKAWTIIAEGEIQRPHYRYLVK